MQHPVPVIPPIGGPESGGPARSSASPSPTRRVAPPSRSLRSEHGSRFDGLPGQSSSQDPEPPDSGGTPPGVGRLGAICVELDLQVTSSG